MNTAAAPLPGLLPTPVWRQGRAPAQQDWLAQEVPVALVVGGISHAVMLATPADLADFALGFALTEGLIADARELYGVDEAAVEGGMELHLDVAAAAFARFKGRRRQMAGRTGCGLCGAESLAHVRLPLPALPAVRLAPGAIARALAELPPHQVRQRASGAEHAAAWCAPDGAVRAVREDVGRHNALDKLIGAVVGAGLDRADGFVLVTSRASFEMVQKTARASMGALVAVSAPTSLAVTLAQQAGLALAGFARGSQFNAYTQPDTFAA